MKVYDIAVIGGGPAGLTAGIYGARSGRSVLIFEGNKIGGQLSEIDILENYPGTKNISGPKLAETMYKQAKSFGAEFEHSFVTMIMDGAEDVTIFTSTDEYRAKNVILCMGITRTKLGFEDSYLGRGVSYCATCDGNFFRNKVVAVAGNGFTAVEDALYLSKICSMVHLVHNKELSGEKHALAKLLDSPNVIRHPDSNVIGLSGEAKLESAELFNTKDKTKSDIAISGLFVALGSQPISDIASGLKLEKNKFIITENRTDTGLRHVYAAGDVVSGSMKQVVSACADAALCVDRIIKAEK